MARDQWPVLLRPPLCHFREKLASCLIRGGYPEERVGARGRVGRGGFPTSSFVGRSQKTGFPLTTAGMTEGNGNDRGETRG